MRASIVIPAHNESATIGATLGTLLAGAEPGELDVIVVANGCTDATAKIARSFGADVTVIETPVASKTEALNLGDAQARTFPRVYLDADISVDAGTVRALVTTLERPGALAAAPTMRMDVAGRPWSVRAYYKVWNRLPYVTDAHLAGVIALSEAGRARFDAFPDVISDDLFVRGQFTPDERVRVDDHSYVVAAPYSLPSLVRVKTRSFMGTVELGRRFPEVAARGRGRGGVRGRLAVLARDPALWPSLACFVVVWGSARTAALWNLRFGRGQRWYRDETTRTGAADAPARPRGLRARLRFAASGADGSLASRLRRRRFEHVRALFATVPRPVSVLDVGGTPGYWATVGMADDAGMQFVLLNLKSIEVDRPNMQAMVGTATAMPQFGDDQFEIVFSNSVIEHVGGIDDQRAMADEIMRVGRRYYVQTPNRYFPMEPHFLFPFFALLPVPARAFLLRHFSLGWYSRIEDRAESFAVARSIRLLTRRELLALFPGAHLVRERVLGLTKSFSVYGGDWDAP